MIVRVLTEFAALLGLGGKPIRFPLTWYKGISPLPKLPLSTPKPPPTFLGPGGKFTRFPLTSYKGI